MKKSLLRCLPVVAAILWAAVIFLWSAEPAPESSATSDPFADAYIALFHPEYESLSPAEQFELHEWASHVVRKAAHFTVYGVLGVLSALSCRLSLGFLGAPLTVFYPFALSALYAVSDEIHQFFVPGRACQLRDILLDSSGALLGVLFTAGIFSLAARSAGKRGQNRDGFSTAS